MYPIEFFWRSVTRFPHLPAVINPDGWVDYATLGRLVYGTAEAICERDTALGSFVGLGAANTVDHLTALLAIMAAGKTWVPLNPLNGDPELLRILDFAQPGLVLGDEAMAARVESSASTVLTFAELTRQATDTATVVPMGPGSAIAIGLGSPQALKFTGGTTGLPKGVLQSYRSWNTNIVSQKHAYRLTEDDRYLVAAPITHGTGTYVLPLLGSGGALVFPEDSSASGLLEAAKTSDATMVFAPPTLLMALAAEQQRYPRDLPRLRNVIYGGAPMRADQIRINQRAFGKVICASYGQTEAPQIVTFLGPDAMVDGDLESVGPASLCMQTGIFDEDGVPVPVGGCGEVCVRGDLVMSGYLNAPEETAKVFHNGWLRTGDLGVLDERGYLFLHGRRRDVIITGGFNVYPSDVEHVLTRHPSVRDAVVVGVPDEKWGEAVHAVIEVGHDTPALEAELAAMVRRELGPVKTPKAIHRMSTLPRSAVGKVRRMDLVAEIERRRKLETS
jgi:fatty-acyl-CoA synthase